MRVILQARRGRMKIDECFVIEGVIFFFLMEVPLKIKHLIFGKIA